VHRAGARLSDGLNSYVMRPHYLYVAGFADGVEKVGTAVDFRKEDRLVEQGAVLATRVAYCSDGKMVRHLEDAVSSSLGLTQRHSVNDKARGLANPVSPANLRSEHGRVVDGVCAFVSRLHWQGVESIRENWGSEDRIELACGMCDRTLYPNDVRVGEHGLAVQGSFGLVILGTSDCYDLVVNLSTLISRRVQVGPFISSLPPKQDSLF
jgi:hypothetical protein